MKKTITLKIMEPKSCFSTEVFWVEVAAPNGNFVVGPGHENLISILKSNSPVSYEKSDGKVETKSVVGGIFSTESDVVTIYSSQT